MRASGQISGEWCCRKRVDFDVELEGFLGDDVSVVFQCHPPVAEFVCDGFPDRITEIKVPVVGFHIFDPCKWWTTISFGVQDPRMIDAKVNRPVFCALDVNDKTELNIDVCTHVCCDFGNVRQLF